MAKSERQRQQKLMKKAAKLKARKAAARKQQGSGPTNPLVRQVVTRARSWPLHEVLISPNWEDTTQLTQILVARTSVQGEVATALFLVDLGCLGVKDAFASLFASPQDYRGKLRDRVTLQPMMACDLNLAAKVIQQGVRYARDLGFEPHPDYHDARVLLGDADPAACHTPVPVGGPGGRPFFVAGPDDDSRFILRKLTERFGPNGFTFTAPLDEDMLSDLEMDVDMLEELNLPPLEGE